MQKKGNENNKQIQKDTDKKPGYGNKKVVGENRPAT